MEISSLRLIAANHKLAWLCGVDDNTHMYADTSC